MLTNIYVIAAEFDAYKIGLARDPKLRLSQLRVSLPFKLEILATVEIPLPHAFKVEGSLHRRYGRSRIKGEWFTLPPKFRTAQEFTRDVCQCAPLLARCHEIGKTA